MESLPFQLDGHLSLVWEDQAGKKNNECDAWSIEILAKQGGGIEVFNILDLITDEI